MNTDVVNALQEQLGPVGSIRLAVLFGSMAGGKAHMESDIDLAVSCKGPLTPSFKKELMEIISSRLLRPVDIIDLVNVSVPTLVKVLMTGKIIIKRDAALYTRLYRQMLFDRADYMPYYSRILEERRKKWIQ